VKLYHKIYGLGDPVIILHGLFGVGDNWRTIARMMESQYQCILADLRNHGRSPHDPEMNFEVMANDVHELILDLDLDRVHLIGHSLGGKVAMHFATHYPEYVDRLIIVDIAPRYYSPHHDHVLDAIESLDPATYNSRSAVEMELRKYIVDDQATIQFLMKNLARLPNGGYAWKANMPAIIRSYEHLMQEVTFLHPFLGPALFIRGENSRYIQDEDMTRILQIFPEAQLKTIAGAGHWVHADAPQEFTDVVRRFLEA
jgi:pimeloyl-ACP methyl ester carboxylesterase